MDRVLPLIVGIAAHAPERTVFTRFITPETPEDRPGQWLNYYRQWPQATRARLPPAQLDLIPSLARFVPPATVIDKPFYSAFSGSHLLSFLTEKRVSTLVFTGTETDVCVLSTALSAVDLGYRVILVEDAMCSSSDEGHDALMTMYRNRMNTQIELIGSDDLFGFWEE